MTIMKKKLFASLASISTNFIAQGFNFIFLFFAQFLLDIPEKVPNMLF